MIILVMQSIIQRRIIHGMEWIIRFQVLDVVEEEEKKKNLSTVQKRLSWQEDRQDEEIEDEKN